MQNEICRGKLEMTPNQQTTNPCNETKLTATWMDARHAAMSQPAHPTTEQPMSERPYDHEALTPTHDALSAIYNREY
jgi:hypothetical protein